MISKTIFLLRHSIRTDLNQQPESDCSITNEGIALAQSRGELIASKLHGRKTFDCVYVSPYKRTIETAYAALAGMYGANSTEEMPNIQIDSRISETITTYYDNFRGVVIPLPLALYLRANGIVMPETLEQVQSRIALFVTELNATEFRSALVCTHAGVLSELVNTFVPGTGPLKTAYCSCVVLRFNTDDGVWVVAESF
jgi:broad specificity phosphatase PhoE